jgi:hypothetical protein
MQRVSWARVTGEGAVIVVSILLALALDAWWASIDAYQEAHRELGVVREELREARTEIETMGLWHDRLGHGMQSLGEQLSTADPTAALVVDDTLLAGALLFPVTDPPLAVLDAFLGSGHLQRLHNPQLRRNLANWRAQVDDQRGDESRARNFEDSELAPYLRSQFEMAAAQEAATSLWLVGLDSLPHATGVPVRLRSNQRIKNLVARQVGWYRLTGSQSRSVLTKLDELLELIDDELGS